jgi:large subunit ribosomal protein L6
MSRVAKRPVVIEKGVEVDQKGSTLTVKGPKGALSMDCNPEVEVVREGDELSVRARSGSRFARAISGTTRALISNMVHGVNSGFERKLELVGVGYRAQAQGNKLNLSLGFSHPVVYEAPEGVTIETPSQTEIFVRGVDKQAVGQVAAELRAFRPPEPYKGKGVRYEDEHIRRKVGKAGA